MWRFGLPALVLGLGCCLACGGRYESSAPDDDGQAGSSSGGRTGGVGGANSSTGGQAVVPVAGSSGLVDVCINQFFAYGEYRKQAVAEFSSFGCMTDADCLSFYDQSACDTTCVLLKTGARRGLVDRLNNFETTSCAQECAPQPWNSCPPPPLPLCVSGSCQ